MGYDGRSLSKPTDATDLQQRCTTIFIGGWSSGPLEYMIGFLRENEPTLNSDWLMMENLPMPPFPGSWCFGPCYVIMCCLQFLVFAFGMPRIRTADTSAGMKTILYAISLGFSIVWIRFIARVAVRSSIQKGVEQLSGIIEKERHHVVVVGFSWGGAVLAEYLAQKSRPNGLLINDSGVPIKAMLIAPTTSLIAKVAMEQDAALRLNQSASINASSVYVIHGSMDDAFCPNQRLWEAAPVKLETLPDNHVFSRSHSRRMLIGWMTELIQSSRSRG